MALFFPCILRGSTTQKLSLTLGGHQAKRLKDDAVKVLKSMCQQVWKTQQWLQDWKRSVLIQIPKKENAKKCSNYHTFALISHTSKGILKISKPGFNSTGTKNFQMFKLDLEKAEEPDQIANICQNFEKARVPEKHLLLLY